MNSAYRSLARPPTWSQASRGLDAIAQPRLVAQGQADALASFRLSARHARSTRRPYSSVSPEKNNAPSPRSSGELPSATDSRRSPMNQRFSHLMDSLQARVLTAGQTLNDITGYTGIESIKAENTKLETALAEAHVSVRTARQAYRTSNSKRANTQREVTTLLARKDTWSPTDLERFTELYRADHVLEGEVASAQVSLADAETEEQSLSQRLNAGILKRYHEEQIWSDRIRRASTWGTWGLMGMNFLLFVVLQFVAEPWRRRRLVKGVVAEGSGVLEEVRGELAAVNAALAKMEQVEVEVPEADAQAAIPDEAHPEGKGPDGHAPAAATWEEFVLEPARWRTAAEDLYSERLVSLRMRDATVLALEGAAAGAVVAGSIAMIFLRGARP